MRKKLRMGKSEREVTPIGAAHSGQAAYLRTVMDSVRQNKVNSLMQRELAEIFQQETRTFLPGGLITVSAVRVSPDLGIAKVYLSLFPVKDKKAVLESIKGAARTACVGF